MIKMVYADVNEYVGTTFYTIDRIRECWWKMAGDALILYFEYIKKWRIDWTNQPRATDKYMMNWLKWGRSKFLAAKTTLKELWLIDIIPWRWDWGLMTKWYTKVNFIVPEEKIEQAMNQKSEYRLVDQKSEYRLMDDQKSKFRVVDNMQLWTGKKNWENANTSSDHQKSENPPCGEMTSNALSILNINAWSNKQYTTYISWSSDTPNNTEKTKLDTAHTIHTHNMSTSIETNTNIESTQKTQNEEMSTLLWNTYWGRPNRKWTKKEFTKLVKTLTEKEMKEALLELRLLKFEYRLWLEDINMCNSCVNAINNRTVDEDMIVKRVEAIVEKFSTHKNRSEKIRKQREDEINEWFSDYLPKWKIWKPERPTTKDWRIQLFEEMDLRWQLFKVYEWFPEVNLSIVEADWRAWQVEQKKKWLLK